MKFVEDTSFGRLRIGLLLFLTLIGICVYLGFQLAPYWINAYEINDYIGERTRTAEMASDDDIRSGIIAKAAEMGLTLTDQDIQIDRSPPTISISATWQSEYNFFGLYTRTFNFYRQVTLNPH
jgi:hypothetical protein